MVLFAAWPDVLEIVELLYGALAMFLLLTGYDLLKRYFQADKNTRRDAAYMTFFIIGAALLGYGVYMFPAIIDYFYENSLELIPAIKFFLILFIITPIAWVCGNILLNKLGRMIISILGGFILLILGIVVLLEIFSPDTVTLTRTWTYPIYIFIGIFAIFDMIGIFTIFVFKLSPQREIRKKVFIGLSGLVVAGLGEIFQKIGASSVPDGALLNFYVYGALIEILGFFIMREAFLSIPSYDEFEWRNGMIELHIIIADTGISLFYHKFSQILPEQLKGNLRVTASIPEDESRPNSDLVAGGLVGIKGMLGEISGEKGKLEQIEIGEKTLIFKQGHVAMALLLADENLGVYHSMLDDLIQKVEMEHPDLDSFSGDTRKLHIKPIVEEVFALKMDKKKEIDKTTAESD